MSLRPFRHGWPCAQPMHQLQRSSWRNVKRWAFSQRSCRNIAAAGIWWSRRGEIHFLMVPLIVVCIDQQYHIIPYLHIHHFQFVCCLASSWSCNFQPLRVASHEELTVSNGIGWWSVYYAYLLPTDIVTSWWFQPIWNILVNLDHFPK